MENFISYNGNLLRDDCTVLREKFAYTFRDIETGPQLCATLRAGEYCFPGGYRMAFLCSDGGVLSFNSVRENLSLVLDSIRNNLSDGWRVIHCFIVDECEDVIYCDDSGEKLN